MLRRWWEPKPEFTRDEKAAIACIRPLVGRIIAEMLVRRLARNHLYIFHVERSA